MKMSNFPTCAGNLFSYKTICNPDPLYRVPGSADFAIAKVRRNLGDQYERKAMEIRRIESQRFGTDFQACLPIILPSNTDTRLKAILNMMAEVMFQSKCDIELISRQLGISRRQVERLFRRDFGASPIQIFHRMRLEIARLEVESSGKKLTEIAYEVGYNSSYHFSRKFRKQFGMSPAQFRAKYRERQK